MAEEENQIIRAHLAGLTPDQRRFRINSGMGWTGDVKHLKDGTLLIRNPRAFHGAPRGSPDLWGWDSVVVTPEMVGQRIAVFVGEEVKTPGLSLSRFQRMFRDCLSVMGGVFRVIR